jgi:hypothetical protein
MRRGMRQNLSHRSHRTVRRQKGCELGGRQGIVRCIVHFVTKGVRPRFSIRVMDHQTGIFHNHLCVSKRASTSSRTRVDNVWTNRTNGPKCFMKTDGPGKGGTKWRRVRRHRDRLLLTRIRSCGSEKPPPCLRVPLQGIPTPGT